MPRWLTFTMLILSPVVMTVAILGMLAFAGAFRKGFGAFTTLRAEAIAIALVLWLIHAGFVLAPFLFANGRRGLAMWLTVPVALVATCLIGWVVLRESSMPRNVASGVADVVIWTMVIGGVIVYWLPVGALATAR